ncbi:MAG: DUF4388 domain-containing protein [Chitinispirillaceae bacterium]|nr:DUF4388 domain-containing protein [Chitinispirillaceae bacterium]
MILHNSPSRHPVAPELYFDTLVVSQDRQLFSQFCSFLREFEPDRKPFLADDPDTFSAFESNFSQCDVMICDMRSSSSSVDLGAYAVDCVPLETLAVGLTGDRDCPQETLGRKQNLLFSGIIDSRKGWLSNWNQITAIKQAWHNPLMVSRIEEVPVSDVLQMIASGRWSVVVHISGYGMSSLPLLPQKAHKGCISFYQGEPQTAWSWNSAGIQAIFDLLSLKKGILQVVKNLCTPTVRNVYLQTDEILLSHAVALDESVMTSLTPPVSHAAPPAAVSSPSKPPGGKATWWSANGERLIATLSTEVAGSLPLRVMNSENIRRILRDQPDAQQLLLYGSADALDRFFSLCSRGFTSDTISGSGRFPVIRIGRSGTPCLYITGSPFSEDLTFGGKPPAVILTPEDADTGSWEVLVKRGHSVLLPVGADAAKLPDLPESPLILPLPDCEQSREGISGMLRSLLSSLMTID